MRKSRLDEEESSEVENEELNGPIDNAWSMKIPEFKKGDMKHSLTEESSFSVIFPKYREKYLKESWPLLQKTFEEYGVIAELDLIEGRMIVRTTRKTWDPSSILKARDIISLLGRSVPIEQALKVLQDGITYELIKIKNLVRNRDRFVKRRQRLVGSNGTTLKALELLTNCYILIQGSTVAAIGPHKGVQQVNRVVIDTMRNVHPVNLLKVLMIKKRLSEDENLKNSDWSKFIPTYKSKNVQRKKHKIKEKKPYTPFPPEQLPRKIDIEMAEGKVPPIKGKKKPKEPPSKKSWMSAEKKEEVKENQKRKRAAIYEPPVETVKETSKIISTDVDVNKLKKKIKSRK